MFVLQIFRRQQLYVVANAIHTILPGATAQSVEIWLSAAQLYEQVVQQIDNKKLSYRRRTARCVVSVEILPIATQQYRNYLYDNS